MPSRKPSGPRRDPPRPTTAQPTPPDEVVDPIWLLKALGLSLIAALLCAWLAVCLLVYQGQWQLVLHPSHTADRTPAALGLPYDEIRFDAADSGQPRLTAWLLPAQAPGVPLQLPPRYAAYTVLYLHDGSGSLSNTLDSLARLHHAGLNVFALEYRGFGRNDPTIHPSQARMTQDAAAALDYLLTVRHIPAAHIVLYGTRLGASLATSLALAHANLPAVILDNPDPDPTATAIATRPSRLIPVRTLFHERFEIADPLSSLKTPKLLIAGGPNSTGLPADLRADQLLFKKAAAPSFTVTLPATNADADFQTALSRFLDQDLPGASSR